MEAARAKRQSVPRGSETEKKKNSASGFGCERSTEKPHMGDKKDKNHHALTCGSLTKSDRGEREDKVSF